MKIIYKYHLIGSTDRIMMPKNAIPLSVAWQDEQITIWALVETEKHTISHKVIILGTGHPIPSELDSKIFLGTLIDSKIFLGTVHNPPFVWHVFYLGEA